MFRTKLPILIVFNKSDKDSSRKQNFWLDDYENFLSDLKDYD